MLIPNRHASSNSYRYGFQGQEKDDELKGEGNSIDLGDRILDPRIGRTFKMDRYSHKFPGDTPYNFAMNTPMCAVDPDGKLIIFIGGLRLFKRDKDQLRANKKGGMPGIYSMRDNNELYTKYWKTGTKNGFFRRLFNSVKDEVNAFGRKTDIAKMFVERIGDDNAYFASGSSTWTSQASDRKADGVLKAEQFHAMVQSGEIKLETNETIKIVSHSQGGAHAEGFAEQLMTYKDSDGNQLYKIEVIYNITPHQPEDINAPNGIRTVQYSHPNDSVASDSPFWMPNGGTSFGKIKGITEFNGDQIIGGEGQPKATGAAGNRNGHNVTDNGYIFAIPEGSPGYVAPRQDVPIDSPDVNKGG